MELFPRAGFEPGGHTPCRRAWHEQDARRKVKLHLRTMSGAQHNLLCYCHACCRTHKVLCTKRNYPITFANIHMARVSMQGRSSCKCIPSGQNACAQRNMNSAQTPPSFLHAGQCGFEG